MPIKLSIVALAILVLASCITPNRSMGTTESSPAPLLGIAVDENLTVLDVEPGSPAEEAGIQRGDVLLNLTWVAFRNKPLDTADTFFLTPGGTPIAESGPMAEGSQVPDEDQRSVTPLPTNEAVDKSPTSFRNAKKAKELIRSGDVVSLRLQRGDQIIEITMQAEPPAPRATTATPLWPPNNLF